MPQNPVVVATLNSTLPLPDAGLPVDPTMLVEVQPADGSNPPRQKITVADIIGGGGGLYASVPLTANEINHLFSVPKELIPAPGAGKVLIVTNATVAIHAGTIPLGSDFGSSPVYLAYNGDTSLHILAFLPVFTEEAGVGSSFNSKSPTYPTNGISTGLTDNTPITLAGSEDDFGDYGAIAAASITSGHGGLGYAEGDTGVIGGPVGQNATYQITGIGSAGVVTTFDVVVGGAGYNVSVGNETTTGGAQPGGGTGFQVDISEITPGNGTGSVTLIYYVLELP